MYIKDPFSYESIAELAKKYSFQLGTKISKYSLKDEKYTSLIKHHFKLVTDSDGMKAYSLLDQKASQENVDGMPVMNYRIADKIMYFAKDNGLQVRGHTLVWDANMSEWFFRTGYLSDGEFVDRETVLRRLEYYIKDVITHFETKYPGVIFCWDVVNEAVADNECDYLTEDGRHIRIYRDTKDNLFYRFIGDDYVELAFLYAKDAVDSLGADIKLFYNEYATMYPIKRNAVCNLITSINSYSIGDSGEKRRLCDGVGMQGYIGGFGKQEGCMNEEDLARIRDAIEEFASMGLEIHITEMAVRNYEGDKESIENHARFYEKLFQEILRINSGEKKPLTSISIWGLMDYPDVEPESYSYRLNSPYCGLFDENMNVKEAFLKVHNFLEKGKNS